jgi:hypothetical protein
MTQDEREAFIARRMGDAGSILGGLLFVGPLLAAIPALLLAVVLAGIFWFVSFAADPVRVWAWFIPALIVAELPVAMMIVWLAVSEQRRAIRRAKLPDDATLRVLTLDADTLAHSVRGVVPKHHQRYPRSPRVHFDLGPLGPSVLYIEPPAEGQLRTSPDGALRVAWSPLRRYYVEWVEVPDHWPDALPGISDEVPGNAAYLMSLPHMERLREKWISANAAGT